jgi:ATP-dependent RNA helicase DeaD
MTQSRPTQDPQEALSLLGPALSRAVADKGYTTLTNVQAAVLAPALAERDLRISSQTGSGKTLAIGFALRDLVVGPADAERPRGLAAPRALVITPTRELAQQVEAELRWLYAHAGARVVAVTGGTNQRDERRALSSNPAIVVGTPGRVLDHLGRGVIDASGLRAVVLDEADRMLDMGFREDIESIFKHAPKERRTHLVSATFPRNVKALADAVQRNPAIVEGTRLGVANADIDHVVHLIDSSQKIDAIVNLLLHNPDAQTLVFARTRIDVANIAAELARAGFAVSSISGELDQAARNRALAAFKRGTLKVLVATDVAARGIDVQDIARVIHAELPTDSDAYTHRSGRTGRAGRKGVSALLLPPAAVVHATRMLRIAGVTLRVEPIPSAEEIRRANEERILSELTADAPVLEEGAEAPEPSAEHARFAELAARLASTGDVARTIARLLAHSRYAAATEPRQVRSIQLPNKSRGGQAEHPARERSPAGGPRAGRDRDDGAWVAFRVSWGVRGGADPRRMLALICRRGNIRGKDVGAIRIEHGFSLVNVANEVAQGFETAAAEPDPREPRIVIRRDVHPSARAAGAAPESGPAPHNTSAPHNPSAPPSRWARKPPRGAAPGERRGGHAAPKRKR